MLLLILIVHKKETDISSSSLGLVTLICIGDYQDGCTMIKVYCALMIRVGLRTAFMKAGLSPEIISISWGQPF